MTARSPLAPDAFPELPALDGIRIAVVESGLRYKGRPDLMLMQFVDGTQVAGVFTRSLCPSAPVDWCRQHLGGGEARGVIVNAGNANAFTGKAGAEACEAVVASVADALTCRPSRIFAASTGVIGVVLPAAKLEPHITAMAANQDQRHCQRLGHDCTGYGDDAGVYRHRCGDTGSSAAGVSECRHREKLQPVDRR